MNIEANSQNLLSEGESPEEQILRASRRERALLSRLEQATLPYRLESESISARDRKKAYSAARSYLESREARIVNTRETIRRKIKTLGSALKSSSPADQGRLESRITKLKAMGIQGAIDLAGQIDCYAESNEPVTRIYIDKNRFNPATGRKTYRKTLAYGLKESTLQRMVRKVLQTYFEPHLFQYRDHNKAVHEALLAIEQGYAYAAVTDIVDCFGQFNETAVDALPLPKGILHVIKQPAEDRIRIIRNEDGGNSPQQERVDTPEEMDEESSFPLGIPTRDSDSGVNESAFSPSVAFTRDNGSGSPRLGGIPQGSAASSIIAEYLIKQFLGALQERLDDNVRIFVYVDDILILGKDRESVQRVSSLWNRLANTHEVGCIQTNISELCSTDEGFTYLGYEVQSYPTGSNTAFTGQVIARPRASKLLPKVNFFDRMAATATVPPGERRVSYSVFANVLHPIALPPRRNRTLQELRSQITGFASSYPACEPLQDFKEAALRVIDNLQDGKRTEKHSRFIDGYAYWQDQMQSHLVNLSTLHREPPMDLG